MIKPAQITLPAPKRLADTLAAIGYSVTLTVARAEVATVDPGSDSGPLDAPITDDEAVRIRATLAAYNVSDKPDGGARFNPPR